MKEKIYSSFLKELKSGEYKKHLEVKQKNTYENFASKEQQRLLYEDSDIYCFKIFDVLNNEQFSKLIGKIYNLNKKNFKVDCRYKKSKAFKKYCYIGINYGTTHYGELATIEFLNDEYIDKLNILWSPLDDWRGFIEYTFELKKPINSSNYEDFIGNYLVKINGKDLKFKIDNADYSSFDFVYKNALNIIFQHYITSFLFTRDGKKFFLPSMSFYTFKQNFNYKNFENSFLQETFINVKENYVIEKNIFSDNYILISSNSIPILHVSKYIMMYGIKFYYSFFGNFEIDKVKSFLSPRVSSIKKIDSDQVEYLFNLMMSSNLERNIKNYEEIENWIYMYGGNEKKKINDKPMYNYKKFYDEYYHYFRNKLELRNLKTTKRLSIIAIIVAIIGVVISIIFKLFSH